MAGTNTVKEALAKTREWVAKARATGASEVVYIVPETLTSPVKVFDYLQDMGIEIIRIAERGPLPGQGQVP